MTQSAIIFAWLVVGTQVSFAALVAPTVFQVLDAEPAGQFLRRLFPRLYAFCGLLCLVSSVLFALDGAYGLASAMAVIGGIHFVARGPLTHRINGLFETLS